MKNSIKILKKYKVFFIFVTFILFELFESEKEKISLLLSCSLIKKLIISYAYW